jgi:hypothetical protein
MFHGEMIGAVVVTFHFRAQDLEGLGKICAQVDLLIVVDNGSNQTELAQIRRAGQDLGFLLLENGETLVSLRLLTPGCAKRKRSAAGGSRYSIRKAR